MAKTLKQVKDKLGEYETAVADRETKQTAHVADLEKLADAIDAEALSRDQWTIALQREHTLEDELEAIITEHEPPDLPSV